MKKRKKEIKRGRKWNGSKNGGVYMFQPLKGENRRNQMYWGKDERKWKNNCDGQKLFSNIFELLPWGGHII
jgi:hypothetical protein